jgi:hypothetical protein
MKKGTIFFPLLALFLLVGTVEVSAQEKSSITVKGSELVNSVVIVDVVRSGKVFELQCNHGAPGCAALKSGKYRMLELPKNFGMYDCRNVEVYPESAVVPEKDKKLGDYCLIEK